MISDNKLSNNFVSSFLYLNKLKSIILSFCYTLIIEKPVKKNVRKAVNKIFKNGHKGSGKTTQNKGNGSFVSYK